MTYELQDAVALTNDLSDKMLYGAKCEMIDQMASRTTER
jgi:hypothetical protein